MTQIEKDRISEMLRSGKSPAEISDKLGISYNTVKSFLRRNKPAVEKPVCPNCGEPLVFTPHKKKKKFCSDKCRMHYWNTHPQEMNLTNATTIQCEVCGKDVLSYRKKPRRFCSRACAVKGRACHE